MLAADSSNQSLEHAAWLELRVVIPLEAQEPVSGWLWEQGIEGMTEEPSARAGEPWVILRAYLPAREAEPLERDLRALLLDLEAFFPGCAQGRIRLRSVEIQDWNAAWMAHFKPTAVTSRLVIRPCWEPYSPQPGEVVLDLDPGMAFGTGTHETTRGCLIAIDALLGGDGLELAPLSDRQRVLDVGTGSGILLIAALKLGIAHGTGLDIDPVARTAAANNCALNALQARVELPDQQLEQVSGTFPLVLANILAPVLIELAPLLARCLAPEGALVLSGLLIEQAEGVLQAFRPFGLDLEAQYSEGEWRTLVLRPTGSARAAR